MSNQSFRTLCVSLSLIFLGEALSAAELIDVRTVDPTIEVELRYTTTRNVLRRPLYPANMPALVRPAVAVRLSKAHKDLQLRGLRLKIWDAYRPQAAHDQLWAVSRDHHYVADPAGGRGSLHTWGVAVDATLIDGNGNDVAMPTDFDDFTPAAMLRYIGRDPEIRKHLRILQRAMGAAGFYGLRTEWWHFIAKDWQKYRAIPNATNISPSNAGLGFSPGSIVSSLSGESPRPR